jgi:hypothetical protein
VCPQPAAEPKKLLAAALAKHMAEAAAGACVRASFARCTYAHVHTVAASGAAVKPVNGTLRLTTIGARGLESKDDNGLR